MRAGGWKGRGGVGGERGDEAGEGGEVGGGRGGGQGGGGHSLRYGFNWSCASGAWR